jgi:thermopsin
LNSGGSFPIWPGSITDQATLQENNILLVRNRDGTTCTYWPQNVIGFSTSNSTLAYEDNVLNITGDLAQLQNQTIQGRYGFVSGDNSSGVEQTYYGNYLANYTYSYTLPLTLLMYMNESVVSGQGVLIQMGVRPLTGESNTSITWYDMIMVDDPAIASASFVVKGNEYTQAGIASLNGLFYDAELIFGGGAGGQAATFSSLSAELALYYQNQTLKPFPSLYTFGVDTAEAAYNIQVTNGSGYALLQSGTPDYGLLTNNFNSSLANAEQSAQQNSSPGVSTSTLVGVVVLAVVVVIVLAFVTMRGGRRPSQPEWTRATASIRAKTPHRKASGPVESTRAGAKRFR